MANSEPTTALETLGTYLMDGTAQRDAIHLAVVPIVATEKVYPGQHLTADGKATGGPPVGIADPFLPGPANPGMTFWLVLYPRTITSLRHAWTHPAFPEAAVAAVNAPVSDKEASMQWLRDLGDRVGVSANRLIESAREHIHDTSGWSYLIGGYEMEGESTPPEFWDHYQIVTGELVPSEKRENFFSCSC